MRYQARLRIDPNEPTFSGVIDIDLTLASPSALLWLNAVKLTVDHAQFTVGKQTISARVVPGGEDFLGFAPSSGQPLPAGPARLHVEYRGQISSHDNRGLYRLKEGDHWYAVTQHESIFARRTFPCFDEPSFKVPWQLTLEVKEGDLALSNTPAVGEKREHPGMKTVSFAPTKPLPSYLVAMAVGPFSLADGGTAGRNKVRVRVAAPAGRTADARWAAQISGPILEQLEAYFDRPYPYEKLDMVTVPLASARGAMENPGLVTFGESVIVTPARDESIDFRRSYARVEMHELAHQWFGDLVTAAWWDDIWLNEAFATWTAAKIVDQWKPDWEHHTEGVKARAIALENDRLVNARKIRQPIESSHDIYNAFDRITYQKGATVLAMFERWVGPEVFRRGVQRYLEKHAWGNATAVEFVAAISAEAGRDVWPAFATFLEQPGAPLVTVELSCRGKPAVTLTQERYLPVGSTGSAAARWQIPLRLRYGAGATEANTSTLLTDASATVSLPISACPDWVSVNDGGTGYFHTLYRGPLLDRLLADGGKHLSLPERMALVDDLSAAAQAGKLPVPQLLGALTTLAKDPSRELTVKVAQVVAGLRAHLVPDALEPAYARFVRGLFGARARALGWSPRPDEDDDARLLRAELLPLVAVEGDDADLREEAGRLVQAWLLDATALSPDLIVPVLRTAAAAGDRALYDRLLTAARETRTPETRRQLLTALSQVRDPALARASLPLLLDGPFDPRDALVLLTGASEQPTTRGVAYEFVKEHFDALSARQPPTWFARQPLLSGNQCDETHRKDLAAFFGERAPRFPGGPRALALALESVHLCEALVQSQQASVAAFLKKYQ
jgi:alanyl aminopeptidase